MKYVEYCDFYTRKMIQENRSKVYLFGDTLENYGHAGQAFAARGEPNTIGIPTKLSPTRLGFLDDRYFFYISYLYNAIFKTIDVMHHVVIPSDGLGYARLAEKAPKINGYLNLKLQTLVEKRKLV